MYFSLQSVLCPSFSLLLFYRGCQAGEVEKRTFERGLGEEA